MRSMMICAAVVVMIALSGGCAGRRPATAEERSQIGEVLAKRHGARFVEMPHHTMRPPTTSLIAMATRPTTIPWDSSLWQQMRVLELGETQVGQRDTLVRYTIDDPMAAQIRPSGQAVLVREGGNWIVVKDR